MDRYEVDYSQKAGKWGVYYRGMPLTAEDTKQQARSFAKTQASPGDTIEVFNRDGWLDDEYIVDDNGELVAAGTGNQGHGGGHGGGLFGADQQNGGGGLFGGDDWF